MPVAEFKLYLDNEAAAPETLDRFALIKVDQAIGMATEAEIEVPVGLDETGAWSGIEEDFTQVFKRIRVEVKVRDGDFIPLIDGPIVGQRFELSASPNDSKIVLVVQDDSVLMTQNETVEIFEDRSADEIAGQLFQDAGLTAETDSVSAPASALTRYLVRRGTTMQFLKELARRHSMFVYVEPSDTPGVSAGFFKRPEIASSDLPELLLVGDKRNINKFSAQFDGLKPLKARADGVDITDQSIVSSVADASDIDSLGDEASHDLLEAGESFLARSREPNDNADEATLAAVNHSSWAYTAGAEVVADSYKGVLRPHRIVSVAGAGGYLSGDWLVSQVSHTITDSSYKQNFSLRRNARSSGSGDSGGLLGGVF